MIDAPEQCDDANLLPGDGCNASCETEEPAPKCVTLLETPEAEQNSTYITPDGVVLVAGQLQRDGEDRQAWVGAFDTDGRQLWSLDLGRGNGQYPAAAYAIQPRDGGFVFGHYHEHNELVRIDAAGKIVDVLPLLIPEGSDDVPRDLLEIDSGVLLGGTDGADFWFERRDRQGVVTSLVREDYLGFSDTIVQLQRHGDVIGALVVVGVANHSDGDAIQFDIQSTLLIEYTEQGVEIRRTLLSGEDEHTSLVGNDLAVMADGTWVVGGFEDDGTLPDDGTFGWAAAVRDGDVMWSVTYASTIDVDATSRFRFTAVVPAEHPVLVGSARITRGVRSWGVQLDASTGALLHEFMDLPASDDWARYQGGGMTADGRVWLMGVTHHEDSVEQWLCSTAL